jgi:anti-sigma factor RsiW
MDGRRVIQAYLDGRMTAKERRRFEARLATDARLAADLEATRRTVALLQALPPTVPPAGLTARIMAQVRTKPAPLRRASWREAVWAVLQPARLVPLAAVSVALVVLIGGRQPAGDLGPQRRTRPLSQADEKFVSECLADYNLAAADRYKSGTRYEHAGEPRGDAASIY